MKHTTRTLSDRCFLGSFVCHIYHSHCCGSNHLFAPSTTMKTFAIALLITAGVLFPAIFLLSFYYIITRIWPAPPPLNIELERITIPASNPPTHHMLVHPAMPPCVHIWRHSLHFTTQQFDKLDDLASMMLHESKMEAEHPSKIKLRDEEHWDVVK